MKFKLPIIYYGYANVICQVNTFNTLYEASLADNLLSKSLEIISPNTPRLVFAFSSKSLTAKTGEIIVVEYSVKNDGVSSTVEYKWVVFIRIVSINTEKELLSKQLDIYETLKPGDIYTRRIEFYIDWKFKSGMYKIIISADFFNNVFSTFTSIKTIALFLTVELVKTKWSLKGFGTTIKVIKKDREAVNALEVYYTINVEYPFKTTSELVWTDVFYLSNLQIFEESVAIKLFESNQRMLATNGNENKFTFKKLFYLDNLVYGEYYLYIFVDKNQLIEKLIDFNSPIKKSVQIYKIISLLRIFELNITKDPQLNLNGYNITVAWKLENIGDITVENPQFTFYGRSLSGSSFQIGSYKSQNTLYPLDVKEESTQLILGLQLYGTFTITIKWQDATESSSDSTKVFIQQFRSADLSVKDLYYTNSLEIKENVKCNNHRFTVAVTYSVENIAYSMNKLKTWTDKISVVCDNDLTISKNLSVTKQLWSSDTYSNDYQFLFSLQERYYPKCKIIVIVNADNGAFELFSFVNNLKEQCYFSIPTKPYARFILTPLYNFSKLNLWKAGSSTEMEYTIKNEGNSSKYSLSTWIDSVYLHRKQNDWQSYILTSGILLGSKAFYNFELGCGESSTNNYTIKLQIPKKASGKYYGYLINDPQNSNVNSFRLLNSNFEVDVLPIEPCNIASTNGTIMSAENVFTGGDKIKFSFEVYNFGKGLAEGSWYDAVYLSKFATITPNDLRLITTARLRDLYTNDFYKVDFELTLPLKLSSGLYFIAFVTDTTKVLFDSDYDNNQASIMIQVKAVTNADIFVKNVTIYSETSNNLEFFWQLNADQSLLARKCDSLYLSFDNKFDYIYDFELSNGYCEAFEINVVSGTQLGDINYKINTLQLPLLPDGSYYGIVHTITNVEETNFENNAGVSEQSVAIEVLELHINVYQEVLIKPNRNNLFKFKPDSKMNTLKVELKTNCQLSYNDIFIQLKTIPTENSFVSKSIFSYSSNQSSIVRNLNSDKYYMVVKSYLATINQPYLAMILIKYVQDIEVDRFEPSKLSVKGKNTVKIIGNFVPQKLEICLKNISGASFLVCAVKVYKVNIEMVFATFDLSDFNLQTERVYQLTVNNKSADQVVEIVIGKIGSMQLKLEVSRRLYRQNETAYVDLVVNNNGDTDIYVPVVFVSCVDLEANFFKNDLKNLPETKLLPDFEIVALNDQPYPSYFYDYLIVLNTNNLGGVLQPRSSTTLRLKVRPINSEFLGQSKITAIPYENSFFLNFINNNIDSYKPPFFTESVWKQLSELLINKVKQNSNEMLHETVNELTTNGVDIYRLSDLVVYHIFRLDGAFFSTNLIDSVDFNIITNEVAYIRSYSAKYSSRNTKNIPLGMGWTDNLHIRLEKSDYDSLLLTLGGKQYSIDFRTSNTSYFSDIWQVDIYGDTAIIILKENNLAYGYNFTENCIHSLTTLTGNKQMTVTCRKGLIYEIFNTESTIQFTYTTSNLLQTITKKSSNSPKEIFTLVYDLFDRLIEFTTPSVVVKYEYDILNNLVKAETSYNLVFKYEFNQDSLVSRITNYVNNQTVLDYNYTYYDYGPVEMHDQINGIKVRYFYDLNGRLLYYEKNERHRVHFVSSMDLSKSTILVNGEIFKRINYDEKQNSVNQIFSDESLSSRKTVFKNETYEVTEYSDRLNNKIKLIKQLVNDNTQIEELILPNNLKERKVFDLKKNVLQIQTRNNDELTLKYDENMNRVFYSHSTGDDLNTCSFEYTEQGYLSAARGQDDYYSIYNSYDAFGKLIKTQMKSDLIVEYVYNDKSNLVEMKTNQNINFVYTRDQNERVTQLKVNGDTLAQVNYTQNGYSLFLPKVSRYFNYIYSANNGKLISYVIGDMHVEKNLVRYEYEYNQKNLLKTLKLYTGVNQSDYVTNYYYDSLNRLVSVKNHNLNTTINVLYDSNGNRLRYQEHIGFGDEQLKENEYVVNQMNQYLSDGVNFYNYDRNGNVIEERNKSQDTVKTYKYYKDGKLSQFVTKDDNCSLKYDCLERISLFNCTKAGLFIFSYQYNNQNPLSIKLSNKTVIYFLYIPGIKTSIGFMMGNKVIYFEYNGYFFVQQVYSPGTIVKPPKFTPNPNPIMPGNPVIFPDIPFDTDTLLPRIDLNTTLGPSNKPVSTSCNTNLGQLVFNIDSVFNQNPIFTSTINKLPDFPIMNRITSENQINFEPPTLSPSIFPKFLSPNFIAFEKPYFTFSNQFCPEINLKTVPSSNIVLSVLDNIGDSSKWVDAACSAAGSFFKQYFLKNNTFKGSLEEVVKGSKTNFFKRFLCNELTKSDVVDKIGNMAGEKVIESLVKKIPYKSKCLKKAIVSIFPEITELINWARSFDPNDILGPKGYGANNYVSNNQKFIFVINFENMANASAPAQLVEVESQLDDQFNYASIMFTRYGFNSFEKNLNNLKRPYLSETLEFGLFNLRVFATISPLNRKLIWQIKTIDKVTGNIPDDASLGFLPPSNGTHGKGFVEFLVLLKPNLPHLTSVKVGASIVFDQNDAIETNIIVYTIDAILPEITMTYIPNGNYILINATDKGSGVNSITVYNGTEKIIFVTDESISSFELPLNNQPYNIYYTAQDNVLNSLPLLFFKLISDKMPAGSNETCHNNCSGNGVCVNAFCQCIDGFKGDNCNVKISNEDLLNEPPNIDIGYLPTNTRGLINLFVKANEENPMLMQINNIPENVLIKYKNQIITSVFVISLNSKNATILTVQSQLGNRTFFNFEVNISTTRLNILTNRTVTISTVFYYPINMNNFEIEYTFQTFVNCYNKYWNNNSIALLSEQIDDFDVVSIDSYRKPSFIELNLVKLSLKFYQLEVKSANTNFGNIDFFLKLKVNSTNVGGQYKIIIVESKIESYKMCNDSLSPVFPAENQTVTSNKNVTTGLVVGITLAILFIVIIASVKKFCKGSKIRRAAVI
ncbi:uncharacterized protein LOC124815105 isoform X1 [Hydra vulgaris]|uniref:uncharacterized protein LOC124815105 isoform X1 n=1 Tax=Hydra vulgaris TaxID=6087 RepID=UPI001F5F7D83|nr:uncharacterized protein LOC124815105 [Hydra vulgaris]